MREKLRALLLLITVVVMATGTSCSSSPATSLPALGISLNAAHVDTCMPTDGRLKVTMDSLNGIVPWIAAIRLNVDGGSNSDGSEYPWGSSLHFEWTSQALSAGSCFRLDFAPGCSISEAPPPCPWSDQALRIFSWTVTVVP